MKTQVLEISEANCNEVVTQYMPLVHKISRQLHTSTVGEYDDVVSNGCMGLLYAVRNYNSNSSQSFIKYAGYMIRFYILNYINKGEQRMIKTSASIVKRRTERGLTNISVVSLDKQTSVSKDGGGTLHNCIKGTDEKSVFASMGEDEEELWCKLFRVLENNFSDRNITIFYKKFGLAGWDKVKGVDLAKEYNTSSVSITNVCNRIIRFLKGDKKTMDILIEILGYMQD